MTTLELSTEQTNFIVHKETSGSTFELDRELLITKIKWVGNVSQETASTLLTMGGDSVEFKGYTKLLIDRYELKEFETGARVWIKEMLKTRGKRLAKNVDRVAIVNAESSMGGIFSNMLTTTISLILPGLTIKKFNTPNEGLNWLLE